MWIRIEWIPRDRASARDVPRSARAEIKEEAVLDALRKVKDPDLHMDVVSLDFVRGLTTQEARVSFTEKKRNEPKT